MKYKFEQLSSDNYKLTYQDKSFEFKSDVNSTKEMQGLIAKARNKMIIDLAKENTSIKDLTIEKKINGKTYYDNSNVIEMEKSYQEEIMLEYFDKKCIQIFKMPIQDLMTDIGLETQEEGKQFGIEFIQCLTGKKINTEDFTMAQ